MGPHSSTSPAGRGRRRGAAQKRVHATDQLHHAEGLGQVIVGARIKAAYLVELGAFRREHHDGKELRRRVLAQAAENLEPIDLGQHDVEQHQIGKRFSASIEEIAGMAKPAASRPACLSAYTVRSRIFVSSSK